MKVFALPAAEDWICDKLVEDWENYSGISTRDPSQADVIWLLADWAWKHVPANLLGSKPVVTTVHHITPWKHDASAEADFRARDKITDLYHVYNQRAQDDLRTRTTKPILQVPYWANDVRWRRSGLTKAQLREKHRLPADKWIVMSAQRDTEGAGIDRGIYMPKSEKGPAELADAIVKWHRSRPDVHVLLGGWRRNYLIRRLEDAGVPYSYFERPPQATLAELYQCADVYAVTAKHEGGPQSLLECGLLGVPMVSTPVGIAEQVLPSESISDDVTKAVPTVPDVERMKISNGGMGPYVEMFEKLLLK